MGERVRRVAAWFATPGGTVVLCDLGFCLVLAAFVWAAYFPSLRHAPRADQWCFLVDTMDYHTFPEVVRDFYSYNRTRTVRPGDTDLFRPVLFTLLAAEKFAFEGDCGLTQGFGVVLHCAMCFLLLALFRRVAALRGPPVPPAPDWLAYAVVAFFALNPFVQELVIWAHLHGYLLFLVLLVGSFLCLLAHAAGPNAGRLRSPALWGAWGLTAVGAFTYELGQFYAVVAAALLAWAVYPKAGAARGLAILAVFAVIPAGYRITNAIDAKFHEGRYVPDEIHDTIREKAWTRATVEHSKRFALYTAVQPFCPSVAEGSYSGGRLHYAETLWHTPSGRSLYGPALAVSAAVVVAGLGVGLVGLAGLIRRRDRVGLLAFLVPFALYAMYAGVTVLGRMNPRPGTPTLMSNSYYAYFAQLFLLGAWFAAVQGVARPSRVRAGLALGFLALAALGAETTRRTNLEVAREMKPEFRALRAFQQFVDDHRHEPGFSFVIEYRPGEEIPMRFHHPVTRAVFGRWLDAENPKYRLTFARGKVIVLGPGPRPPAPEEPEWVPEDEDYTR